MPYYGDENDEGVVSNHNFETDGTKWGYKYVVVKAKVNGDNLILGAEPIKREGAHVKVTKKLLQKVKDRVKIQKNNSRQRVLY